MTPVTEKGDPGVAPETMEVAVVATGVAEEEACDSVPLEKDVENVAVTDGSAAAADVDVVVAVGGGDVTEMVGRDAADVVVAAAAAESCSQSQVWRYGKLSSSADVFPATETPPAAA